MQALPLDMKVKMTKSRIKGWVETYGEDGVYVSFSGGKDSTVLLHLVREEYPDIEAVFVNTGLEYPEIQKFAQSFDNVTVLRPKMRFDEVIRKYGYPVISKEVAERVGTARRCIEKNGEHYVEHFYQLTGKFPSTRIEQMYNGRFSARYDFSRYAQLMNVDFDIDSKCYGIMKKGPIKKQSAHKMGITAQMAEESQLRTQEWLKNGCNGFDMKRPISNPMSFWTEQDVLKYIYDNKLPICSVYGDVYYGDDTGQMNFECGKLCTSGCKRTGCIFCLFGAHLEKGEGRLVRLKRTHPRQYEYCMYGGAYDSDGKWKPDKNGLGMKHVIDEINRLYGENFIRY